MNFTHIIIAEIARAPTKEAAQAIALMHARQWAQHWDKDRQYGVTITAESVADCLAVIGAAQNWRAPVALPLAAE